MEARLQAHKIKIKCRNHTDHVKLLLHLPPLNPITLKFTPPHSRAQYSNCLKPMAQMSRPPHRAGEIPAPALLQPNHTRTSPTQELNNPNRPKVMENPNSPTFLARLSSLLRHTQFKETNRTLNQLKFYPPHVPGNRSFESLE